MASFCLNPHLAEQFKKDILNGKINPEELAAMTSAKRHAFFAKALGESNASGVNALFESKLLLKNKQAGMVNWARRVLGENTSAGRNAIAKIKRMDKILSPAEEEAFLEDLAAQRLGTHVTYEEAQKITELSKKIDETKAAMENDGDRMNYGRAVVALRNYLAELKGRANVFSAADFKSPGRLTLKVANRIAGNAKAIKASMDNSAIFRQGWRTLLTHPGVWIKNAKQSFVDLVQTFGGKEVLDEVDADIASRPTYDLMQKAKLDVGVVEEAYPSSLPEKIPVVGRVYKASEYAFTAFVRRTRADVFDKYVQIAEKSGVDLTDNKELQSIGRLVNSLTGRGHLGPFEPAAGVVNNVFFSPRALKATIDTLLLHPTDDMSGFARKQAAYNLLKIIAGTATILAVAKALRKDSVELDPRSADFGKIRVKDTRFDVTGGMASVVTLAARLITLETKSSTTGTVTPLNARGKDGQPLFGAETGTDVVYNFFENKLSPVASVVKDLLKGQDFSGKKPTVAGELNNLFTPLPITTFLELKNNPNSANILVSMIADALGIATNTYSLKPQKNSKSTNYKAHKVSPNDETTTDNPYDFLEMARIKTLQETSPKNETISDQPKRGFIGSIEQVANDLKQAIEENIPFLDNKWGKVIKQEALTQYPFTDDAKRFIEKNAITKDVIPEYDSALLLSKRQDGEGLDLGGVHLTDGEGYTTPVTRADYLPHSPESFSPTVDNAITRFFFVPLSNDKSKVQISVDAPHVVAHEFLHAIVNKNNGDSFDADGFNQAYEATAAKTNNDVFRAIDDILNTDDLYAGSTDWDVANERFAYIGETYGAGGLKAIPQPLQKYYKGIFK